MRRSWTEIAIAVLLVGTSCGSSPDPAIAELEWSRTPPASGRVEGGSASIDGSGGERIFPLATIEDPDVGGDGYELTGEVRYEGVTEPAYLEMWSVFPDGGRYFSRTLASQGPLAVIEGDSEWRPFTLPFSLEGSTSLPSQLEVNLVLPSSGHVWVGPVRLVELGKGSSAWWSERTAGTIGGVVGGVLGLLGATIGVLASRGRGRRWVLATMVAMLAVGCLSLAGAAAAAIASQPSSVTFTLLLPGVILTGVVGSMFRNVRRAYAQAELRRMRALDVA